MKKTGCLTSYLAESKMLSCDYFLAVLNLFQLQTSQISGVKSAIHKVKSLKNNSHILVAKVCVPFTFGIFCFSPGIVEPGSVPAPLEELSRRRASAAPTMCAGGGKMVLMVDHCWWVRYAGGICRFFLTKGYFLA